MLFHFSNLDPDPRYIKCGIRLRNRPETVLLFESQYSLLRVQAVCEGAHADWHQGRRLSRAHRSWPA
jgi:hypothetical protein